MDIVHRLQHFHNGRCDCGVKSGREIDHYVHVALLAHAESKLPPESQSGRAGARPYRVHFRITFVINAIFRPDLNCLESNRNNNSFGSKTNQNLMNIGIIGATGNIGQRILTEARSRGHQYERDRI